MLRPFHFLRCGCSPRSKALLLGVFALALAGCSALPAPFGAATHTARPTRTHRPTKTPEPAQLPTEPPSATPPPLPTLAPTQPAPASITPTLGGFTIIASTPTIGLASFPATATPPTGLDCKLIWQSPRDNAIYLAGDKFSAGWRIRNVGTLPWQAGSFEFTFLGGYRLSHDFNIPLTASVSPGQDTTLSVPMKAPRFPNHYTTHWGIRQGDTFFCHLTLTISVHP